MNKGMILLLALVILTLGCTQKAAEEEVEAGAPVEGDLGNLTDLPEVIEEDLGDLGTLGMGSELPTSPDI